MADMNTVLEGSLKFREGKKWKQRWCIIRKLSPVADRLHIYLYKDENHTNQEKTMFPLENFFGIESGFTLDKEQHVMAILCQSQVAMLAFNSQEILIQWQIKIRDNLGQEHQFPVKLLKAPQQSTIPHGPVKIYVRGERFCLTANIPPKILQSWHVHDLRKFGVVDNKFAFEAGSRSGKGAGVHVLMTEHGQEITDILKQSTSNNQGRTKKSSMKRRSHMSQQSLASNMSMQSTVSATDSYNKMFDIPNIYVDLGFKSQTLNSQCSSVESTDDITYSDRHQLINNAHQSQPIRANSVQMVANNTTDSKSGDTWCQTNTLPKRHSQGELNICIKATVPDQNELYSKPGCLATVPKFIAATNKHRCSSLEYLSTANKNMNCFNHCKLPKCSKKDFFANGISTKVAQHIPLCGHNGSVGNVTENSRTLVEEILKEFKCLGSAAHSPLVELMHGKSSHNGNIQNSADSNSSDYVNENEMHKIERKPENENNKRASRLHRGSQSFRRSFTDPNFSLTAVNDESNLPINEPLPSMDFSKYDGNKKEGYSYQLKYSPSHEESRADYMNCQLNNKASFTVCGQENGARTHATSESKPDNAYMNLPTVPEQKCDSAQGQTTNYAYCYHDMKGVSANNVNVPEHSTRTQQPQTPLYTNCPANSGKNLIHENTYENIDDILSNGKSSNGSNAVLSETKNHAQRDYENVECLESSKPTNPQQVDTVRLPLNGDLFGLPTTYKTSKCAAQKASHVDLSTKVPLERESTYMITSFPGQKVKSAAIKESDYMLMQPSKKTSPKAQPSRLNDIHDADEEIFCAVNLPIRKTDSCKSYQSMKHRDSNYLLMNGKSKKEEPSYMEMNLSQQNCRIPALPIRSQSVREGASQRPKFHHSKSLDCEIEENYLLMDGNSKHHGSKSSGEVISEDQSSSDESDDEVKITEPFGNLIQPKNYSTIKVTLPPKIPPRDQAKSDVPNRHNSLKSTQEMEKHVKNRKFPWFQRRNSSREHTISTSSKSSSKSQESILSSSDGAKELSNSAPSEQAFMRPRSGSADLLSMPADISRERSASVPNKSWLGPVIGNRTRAGEAFNECYSSVALPAGGNQTGTLDEVSRSRSSSDASNASTDLPPPLPPRNPTLANKSKLNASSRSITPPSANSLLASSTPNDTSRTSQNDSTGLHISEESLNLSGGSSNSSNSTASTSIDTSSVSSTSHSFPTRSASLDSSKPRLPQRHSSVKTYHQQEPVVVKVYTRHDSLERRSKSSRSGLMSSLRRGSRSKKPPSLMVEIPHTTNEENDDCLHVDDSGCLWVEHTMPKSATPSCTSRELEMRNTETVDGKSMSDTSDIVDTISWSSLGSSETTRSEDTQKVSPAYTTLRPRFGKEYQRLDRKKLVEDLSPGVSSMASVFTFDRVSVESSKMSMTSGSSLRSRRGCSAESTYMNVNFPRDGKYLSDSTPPDSPYSPCSTDPDSPLLNYAEIDLVHMEKSKKRPRRPHPKPSSTEYATIDMIATTTASRVGKEHAQLREARLKPKEKSKEANVFPLPKEGSVKRKDRKNSSK